MKNMTNWVLAATLVIIFFISLQHSVEVVYF